MTRADMERAATLLYGREWQAGLARLMGVAPRYVRFWKAGERPMPLGLGEELEGELWRHAQECENEAQDLRDKRIFKDLDETP